MVDMKDSPFEDRRIDEELFSPQDHNHRNTSNLWIQPKRDLGDYSGFSASSPWRNFYYIELNVE